MAALLDFLVGNKHSRWMIDELFIRMAQKRVRNLDQLDAVKVQRDNLFYLLQKAKNTQFAADHHFNRINSIRDYQQLVPIREYEFFWQNYWQKKYPSIENQTWPGNPPYIALSSGTTSGTTKYIPVSKEMLASNRKSAFTTLSLYRAYRPNAHLFYGNFFFLAGNTDLKPLENGSRPGDLSAISALAVPQIARLFTFPPLSISGIKEWDDKLTQLAEQSIRLPIVGLSGVPSWMLVLFDRVKQLSGKNYISDIWPELRLIIHGGTKFEPFRPVFEKEINNPAVDYIDVYPCSEGYVATEDPRYKMLRLIVDHNIFFEFVPTSELKHENPTRHTLESIDLNVEYAVVMTTCAGLWSYVVGDTVSFTCKSPPLLRFTGRTKYFLSAFGEHLIYEEIDKAIAKAAEKTNSLVKNFHVGPIFPDTPGRPGHHLYLVEFAIPPHDTQQFCQELDHQLCILNEDYQAHRKGNISMLLPELKVVQNGGCAAWMLAHGKQPPQHKFPNMDNSGIQTKSISDWLKKNQFIQ